MTDREAALEADDAVRLLSKPRPETITLIESAIQVGLSAKDILGALYAHLALAGSAAKPSRDEVLEAARNVHDTFKRDLDQGYRTKDKEFAVDLLGRALAGSANQPSRDEAMREARRTLTRQVRHHPLSVIPPASQPSRDAVLEEAAKVAEAEGEKVRDENADRYWQSKRIAGAIRSLKSPAGKVTP